MSNPIPTGADEQLVIDLARELYDRFVMGGWQPADAHDQIREMLRRAAASPGGWRPISEAPRDGSEVLLYRPLAQKTNDPVVAVRKTTPYDNHCWACTIPEGADGKNFTEGACYATHFQPLPEAPKVVP